MSHYIIKARANRIAALEAIGVGSDNIFGEIGREGRSTLRMTQRRLLRRRGQVLPDRRQSAA